MFEDDYIMREIGNLAKFIARYILGSDVSENNVTDDFGNFSEQNFLLYRLRRLIEQNRICDAEDELFAAMEQDKNSIYLKTAYDFYGMLNKMSDEALAEGGFSRNEIFEGMTDAARLYNIEYSTE